MSGQRSAAIEVTKLKEAFGFNYREAQKKRKEIRDSGGTVTGFLIEHQKIADPENGTLVSKLLAAKSFVGECGDESLEILEAYTAIKGEL